MAPLLGRKPYPLVKPLTEPPGPGEEVYTVEHTKEAFRNKEEYEARLQSYGERIWTCRSTGSGQLTHREAWDEEQEVTALLQEEYPLWFEKPVLEIVHHNTISLDKLVVQAWVEILTKYAVGEECDYWVGDEATRVRVLKVHPLETPEQGGACDSPSSDKENTAQENQRKEAQPKEEEGRRGSLREWARRSPRKPPASQKGEKKKWEIPKFLPHKYDLQAMEEEKTICSVPAESLFRTERPPTKEILRYFIRHNALRLGCGDSAPWLVEDELVIKYSLPSKLSNFLINQHKHMADNPSAKRKSVSEGRPAKKLKTADEEDEEEEDEEEEADKKSHMQSKKVNGTPLKVKRVRGDAANSKTAKKTRKGTAKGEKVTAKGTKTKPLDLANGGVSPTSPRKSGRRKSLPPAALNLIRYYEKLKRGEEPRYKLSPLVTSAAKALSAQARASLPEEVQQLVQRRWEALEQKKMLAAMGEEERREVLCRKKAEMREKIRERARERARERRQQERRQQERRFEDQELEGQGLPAFRLVDTPEGLPNALFGDVAMVTDFLNCYSDLLMPDDRHPIVAGALMEALVGNGAGFLYLSRVLVILLQTLLQDELAEGYSELDTSLSELPLTTHSVSELARLCLRPCDAQGEESEAEGRAQGGYDDVLSAEFLGKLETSEIFELSPAEKVGLLVALCHRILMTYSADDHVEAVQQRTTQLWKDRVATLKAANDRKRAEKRQRQRGPEAPGGAGQRRWVKVDVEGGAEVTPVASEPRLQLVRVRPQNEGTFSCMRSPRLQAKKEEEEKQERPSLECVGKEADLGSIQEQKDSAERLFQAGIAKARLVIRRLPLGTDRNHNRYWLFSDEVPGLYIEKGWVHESVDYHFTLPPEEDEEEEEDEEAEAEDDDELEKVESGSEGTRAENGHQGALSAAESMETTIPNVGQNLWCVCDTEEQLEELMESLHTRGVREGELKTQIQGRYEEILHSMRVARQPVLQLKSCDRQLELIGFLRSDIMEVASRLQKGGLGYVGDITEFEEKVCSLEKLQDFGECVIALQAVVLKKYLQGFMAPKQKKKKKKQGVEEAKPEEVDEEKRLAAEAKVATAVERWRTAVREVQTFSRMHVLLGMLDACIKWDMSAENTCCKVCRKRGQDDKLALCDDCNRPYHLFCLRPALYSIPQGHWQCPACQPTTRNRSSRSRTCTDEEVTEKNSWEEESDDNDDDEEDKEYHPPMKLTLQTRPKVKASGTMAARKQPPPNPRSGKSRVVPSNPANIDELVRQCSGSAPRRLVVELAKCEEILQKLLKFRPSWPFRDPVSPEEAEVYLEVVSNPMDFQTILTKFSSSQYRQPSDFVEDVKLVFSNAELYHQPDSDVAACLAKTERSFTDLLHKLLPGVAYLRRRHRRRPEAGEEKEERNSRLRRSNGSAKGRYVVLEEDGGRRKRTSQCTGPGAGPGCERRRWMKRRMKRRWRRKRRRK
ncbi:hypothetical protein COCON_G00188760 [Conger conger]|uniref:Tyrosine-protein kinase BAZ1B n=1 Tax=Conger conger TaxID=82655 RepID=A0A9Q1D3R3_CONCO|nr:hypothetical protein COCON_G00188760 [Conger conger]